MSIDLNISLHQFIAHLHSRIATRTLHHVLTVVWLHHEALSKWSPALLAACRTVIPTQIAFRV